MNKKVAIIIGCIIVIGIIFFVARHYMTGNESYTDGNQTADTGNDMSSETSSAGGISEPADAPVDTSINATINTNNQNTMSTAFKLTDEKGALNDPSNPTGHYTETLTFNAAGDVPNNLELDFVVTTDPGIILQIITGGGNFVNTSTNDKVTKMSVVSNGKKLIVIKIILEKNPTSFKVSDVSSRLNTD